MPWEWVIGQLLPRRAAYCNCLFSFPIEITVFILIFQAPGEHPGRRQWDFRRRQKSGEGKGRTRVVGTRKVTQWGWGQITDVEREQIRRCTKNDQLRGKNSQTTKSVCMWSSTRLCTPEGMFSVLSYLVRDTSPPGYRDSLSISTKKHQRGK